MRLSESVKISTYRAMFFGRRARSIFFFITPPSSYFSVPLDARSHLQILRNQLPSCQEEILRMWKTSQQMDLDWKKTHFTKHKSRGWCLPYFYSQTTQWVLAFFKACKWVDKILNHSQIFHISLGKKGTQT